MRGPSSSHTAASWRIATLGLQILNETLKSASIGFDINGAWAHNYIEQGTAMGINAGLLGLDISDDRMKNTNALTSEMNVSIDYELGDIPNKHVNSVQLSLEGIQGKKVKVLAASLGGGSFEIQKINEFDVSIYGDSYEMLIFMNEKQTSLDEIKKIITKGVMSYWSQTKNGSLVNLKSAFSYTPDLINQIKEFSYVDEVVIVNPILTILTGNESEMPFKTIESLINYSESENMDLGDLGLVYEKNKSGLSDVILSSRMQEIVRIINDSINIGLKGTEYKDRILSRQSHLIAKTEKEGKILQKSVINNTIAYVTAVMESKSGMEVIVANPTAGSCGTVGGVLKAVAEDINATEDDLSKAYFASGLVGIYFANDLGFSAEEHACQVECGAASAMAAAAIAQLFGGSAKQALNAASMAIQNMIGLVCDPVADRVEVPCLGKNISAAMNALSSATMACSGYDAVVPLNEVIETVARVSKQMPSCLKCTGKGGLAITPTSLKLKDALEKRNH